jgi:hypothetical protein
MRKPVELENAERRSPNDTACFEGMGEATAAQHTQAFRKLDRKIIAEMLREAGLLPRDRSRAI